MATTSGGGFRVAGKLKGKTVNCSGTSDALDTSVRPTVSTVPAASS